jgi:hypothetical protein
MTQTLPTCTHCSTPFWPTGRLDQDPETHICDSCAAEPAEVALSGDPNCEMPSPVESRRSIEVIRSYPKQPPLGARVQIQPRELPGMPSPPQPKPTPAVPQTLAFNCPACMAVLNITRDLAIAGTTAPCPHCASMIIPPRIAPATAVKPTQESRWRPER